LNKVRGLATNFDEGLSRFFVMRATTRFALALSLGAVLAGSCTPAWAAQAYEGFWASTKKDCRDQDSANRMSIEGGNRLYWYETRCRASEITAGGKLSWKMKLACEGEGEKFRSNPRVSITADGRLVMDNSPVGQGKRQAYVRCEIAKPR
jgi:hypothetical protein